MASILAVLLVGLAFWLSGPVSFHTQRATAENTEALLKAYAEKDSDADGLPDWKESLYATDPENPHSVGQALTDGEAVEQGLVKPRFTSQTPPEEIIQESLPGTAPASQSLTDQFARQFLQGYLESTGGQPMSASEQEAFVSFLIHDLAQENAKILVSDYTITSVSQSTNVEVLTYIDAVEKMLRAYSLPRDAADTLSLLDAYIKAGDAEALPTLVMTARMYENLTVASLRLSVPPSLAPAHLAMVRSFDTLGRILRAVETYEEDPLPTLSALSLYAPASHELLGAFYVFIEAAKAKGAADNGKPGTMLIYMLGETPDSL